MRGQKLFVRPIEAADHDAIGRFLREHGEAVAVPACGLLGKLVGALVAVVGLSIIDGAIEIETIVVASELRRKRIGRYLLDEVEQLAVKMERDQLTVADGVTHEFFGRVGFEREGARWIRQVRSQGAQRQSR